MVMWEEYPITEASWEPKSHLQNAPLILEDYLCYVGMRINVNAGIEGTGRRVDGGFEEDKATRAFVAEGSVLVGGLRAGKIVFSTPNLCGWSYRLCTGPATTVIIVALVGAGPTL